MENMVPIWLHWKIKRIFIAFYHNASSNCNKDINNEDEDITIVVLIYTSSLTIITFQVDIGYIHYPHQKQPEEVTKLRRCNNNMIHLK